MEKKELITAEQKFYIISIIKMFFPQAKIYLFGSYARGDYRRDSDLDIAIDNGSELPLGRRFQIMNMIEALNLIPKVDVVDFHAIPEDLKKNIVKDGVEWKN